MINQIRKGGIKDIKVVLGSHFKEIKKQIIHKDIEILENPEWKVGISSSIKCSLSHINMNTQAVIFFIVDQPYLDFRIVYEILEKFRTSDAKIITVNVSGRLTHPVLFRKELFPQLMALKGDVGGKTIFSNEILETINWKDERMLMDIDSIEDLGRIEECEN